MILTVFAGIAEFERKLIRERTTAGRVPAQARGVRFGRPAKIGVEQALLTEKLLEEGRTAREVASVFRVQRATVYRATARRRDG